MEVAPMAAAWTRQSCLWSAVYVSGFRGHTWVSSPLTGGSRPMLRSVGWWKYWGRETPGSHFGKWMLAVNGNEQNRDAWAHLHYLLRDLGSKGCLSLAKRWRKSRLDPRQCCFHPTKRSSQIKVGMLIIYTLPRGGTMFSLDVLSSM